MASELLQSSAVSVTLQQNRRIYLGTVWVQDGDDNLKSKAAGRASAVPPMPFVSVEALSGQHLQITQLMDLVITSDLIHDQNIRSAVLRLQ